MDIKTQTKELLKNGTVIGKTVTVSFGKNGHGLTTEFREISKIVEDLSKEGNVYLSKSFIDELDDVYDLTFNVLF